MIKTQNAGILEAVETVKTMSMRKTIRAIYEAHLKARRDRQAQDHYVRTQGIEQGKTEDIIAILETKGTVEDSLREAISGQTDMNTLRRWVLSAAQAGSVDEFRRWEGL